MSVPATAEDGKAVAADGATVACAEDNGGLTLPGGFCATIFADGLGNVRHITVAADGTVYANARIPRHKKSEDEEPSRAGLAALRDTNGDGVVDVMLAFGSSQEGGTGIGIYKNWLYSEYHDRIVRYALPEGDGVPQGEPEIVVSGLPVDGNHVMHPFAIDESGNLFVDLGSATNSCQERDRIKGSPGLNPCEELETRGGIWRYDANKTNQVFSSAERYATGLRNAEGIAFDASGRVFATQHGRDQLYENWPELYSPAQGSELPAEELVLVEKGGDYGWPFCYYDGEQQKRVLAPEYGGDGKAVGDCGDKLRPVAAFPGHWAPNDLKIYKGTQFPESYRGGAFIAFHGSWNRTSGPQEGYNVVFQPLADGKASGKYAIFADGFKGKMSETGAPDHRPTGLAVGPDGALYVSDDAGGRIWRIVYKG